MQIKAHNLLRFMCVSFKLLDGSKNEQLRMSVISGRCTSTVKMCWVSKS